jgi:hypothetical protein
MLVGERAIPPRRVMTLDSINHVALFAGVFLLMSRSGHHPHPSENRTRSRSGKRSESRSQNSCVTRVAPVLDVAAGGGKAAEPADAASKTSAGTYAAILTPYGCGGRYFGGHYG